MFRTLAIVAGLTLSASSLAYAQDPVSAAIGTAGAIAGTAVGTAGAVAGGAVGVATGTAGAVVGYNGRRCAPGYRFDEGACYPR
jgi:FtsH-binding integral membrane protein